MQFVGIICLATRIEERETWWGAFTCRQKFPMVCQKIEIIAQFIERTGPEKTIDMDGIGMRLALDVVALVGTLHQIACGLLKCFCPE